MIKTFEEAHQLILELQICTIFESSKTELPSLWKHLDLPEKQEGEKGWGQKVSAVWDWKIACQQNFLTRFSTAKSKAEWRY